MDKISPELAARMAEAIRYYIEPQTAQADFHKRTGRSVYAEMVDIARNLPPPIDTDLIEARKICQNSSVFWDTSPGVECDLLFALSLVLAAIKRGRELAGGAA